MLQFIITFISLVVVAAGVCVSLYGWGLLFHRIARRPVENWVLTVIVGLGAIVFLGGVFNLLRFAYGWAFDSLLIIGIVLVVKYGKFRLKLLPSRDKWFHIAVVSLLIVVIMSFTVKTQLPPRAFNCHDDFQKYFAHPVRMLQVGTLFGSPLSTLGSETLGGQAVLHGIVLNHFPIPYINGVDAIFGLFLCLILSVSVLPMRTAFLPISLISPLIVFFINPQYVNVSALYIASALMMASILLFSNIRDDENEKTGKFPSPVLIGLIYAALIAVKSTFVVFSVLHLSFFVVALKLYGVDIRRLARWGVVTTSLTALFLLPWFLLYLPHYVQGFFSQVPHDTIITLSEHLNLLSSKPLRYGSNYASYTFISIAIAAPIFGIIIWKHRERAFSRYIALAGLVSGGATVVIAYLVLMYFGPMLSGYATCLRYSIPFLIAGAPTVLSLVYLWAFKSESLGFKLSFIATSLLLGVLVIVIFSDTLMKRVHQGYKSGSILAFSDLATKHDYVGYCEEVIHGDTKLRVIAAQKQIPSGQAVVAWMNTPFYLDYKRNVIFDVEPAGISSPWAYIPDVNYFMVEYKGAAVRSLNHFKKRTQYPGRRKQYIAGRCIEFMQSLQEIRQNADEIYDDGKIAILKRR